MTQMGNIGGGDSRALMYRFADSVAVPLKNSDSMETITFSEQETLEERMQRVESSLKKNSQALAENLSEEPKKKIINDGKDKETLSTKIKEMTFEERGGESATKSLRKLGENPSEEPEKRIVKDHKGKETLSTKIKEMTFEERVGESATKCLRKIAADSNRRLRLCKKDPTKLNEGVYYANEYLATLLHLRTKKFSPDVDGAIEKRYQTMLKNGSFYHGFASPAYFKYEENSGSITGKTVLKYLLKDSSITPSAALDAVISGAKKPIFLDCRAACQIAYYEALRKLFGKEKFNLLFAHDSLTPFSIGGHDLLWPFRVLVVTVSLADSPPLKKGDWVVIKGPRTYGEKHINGEASNWNVLCHKSSKGKPTYVGLGLNSKGVSHLGVKKTLLKEYNAEQVGFQCLSKELAERLARTFTRGQLMQAEQFKGFKISLAELEGLGGGEIASVSTLNKNKVEQLMKATPKKARLLFEKWNKDFRFELSAQ